MTAADDPYRWLEDVDGGPGAAGTRSPTSAAAGEYGPSWHAAARREHRPWAFEDFAAVARDLVATGVVAEPDWRHCLVTV